MRPPATVWLDYTTGTGIDDGGRTVKPLIGGRRQKPQLVDLLETARHHDAQRLMLTGAVPTSEPGTKHWLIVSTEGWKADPQRGHWTTEPATGRFVHMTTDSRVEVRLAREWFGETVDSPRDAREAWDLTRTVIERTCKGAGLLSSPAGTGQNIWALNLPKNYDGDQLDEDTAHLIHATSGQHRQEHLAINISGGAHDDCHPLINADKIDGFAYLDMRFAYSALCRELGTTPAQRLTAAQATDLASDQYARARYRVRFTVPQGWDTLGILGVQRTDIPGGHWMYPNRPGATYETWCDAAELHIAQIVGWHLEILEAIALTKGRPLDTFISKMLQARDAAATLDVDEAIRRAVNAALRMILLQAIGAFHSRGRDRTIVVDSLHDVPPDVDITAVQRHGDVYVYRIPAAHNERVAAFQHPEYTAQVWGRERARDLYLPIAQMRGPGGVEVNRAGALDIPPDAIIGINGDALYTTYVPHWALPVDQGGGDDGKTGRMRLQGYLPGPLPTPTSSEARNRLRKRAEAAGTEAVTAEVIRW